MAEIENDNHPDTSEEEQLDMPSFKTKPRTYSKWYLYHMPPMDFGWSNFPAVSKQSKEVQALFEEAKDALRKAQVGWEGDIRHEVGAIAAPEIENYRSVCVGFVLKQDNNGETFVASLIRMPQLEDPYYERSNVTRDGTHYSWSNP